jgi:hypothetical protein
MQKPSVFGVSTTSKGATSNTVKTTPNRTSEDARASPCGDDERDSPRCRLLRSVICAAHSDRAGGDGHVADDSFCIRVGRVERANAAHVRNGD